MKLRSSSYNCSPGQGKKMQRECLMCKTQKTTHPRKKSGRTTLSCEILTSDVSERNSRRSNNERPEQIILVQDSNILDLYGIKNVCIPLIRLDLHSDMATTNYDTNIKKAPIVSNSASSSTSSSFVSEQPHTLNDIKKIGLYENLDITNNFRARRSDLKVSGHVKCKNAKLKKAKSVPCCGYKLRNRYKEVNETAAISKGGELCNDKAEDGELHFVHSKSTSKEKTLLDSVHKDTHSILNNRGADVKSITRVVPNCPGKFISDNSADEIICMNIPSLCSSRIYENSSLKKAPSLSTLSNSNTVNRLKNRYKRINETDVGTKRVLSKEKNRIAKIRLRKNKDKKFHSAQSKSKSKQNPLLDSKDIHTNSNLSNVGSDIRNQSHKDANSSAKLVPFNYEGEIACMEGVQQLGNSIKYDNSYLNSSTSTIPNISTDYHDSSCADLQVISQAENITVACPLFFDAIDESNSYIDDTKPSSSFLLKVSNFEETNTFLQPQNISRQDDTYMYGMKNHKQKYLKYYDVDLLNPPPTVPNSPFRYNAAYCVDFDNVNQSENVSEKYQFSCDLVKNDLDIIYVENDFIVPPTVPNSPVRKKVGSGTKDSKLLTSL